MRNASCASGCRIRAVLFSLALASLAGCRSSEIHSNYGKVEGPPVDSVNGTAVLATMFQRAGFKVSTWRRLSPRLEQAEVIVWVPDRFGAPPLAERNFLEDWLSNDSGRSLIYVGRDYDATVTYWSKMLDDPPSENAMELLRRRAFAQAEFDRQRQPAPAKQYARWFTSSRQIPRPVETLEGPWAQDVDVSQIELMVGDRTEIPVQADIPAPSAAPRTPPPGTPKFLRGLFPTVQNERPELADRYEVLLKSGEDPLVLRITDDDWEDGQILVVTNGSFLLNLPLVNHEHRKLAGRLVNSCGSPGKVVFLESDSSGLRILDKEPGARTVTGWELFTVWPVNVILFHLIVLGTVYCFVRYPIFGRPRTLPAETVSDFGRHVQSLGELLAKTGDEDYARHRVNDYHLHVRRDSGASHQKGNS